MLIVFVMMLADTAAFYSRYWWHCFKAGNFLIIVLNESSIGLWKAFAHSFLFLFKAKK
jgi:hypothetical protein